MDLATIIQSAVGAAAPVIGAAWFLSSRLTSIDTRVKQVEHKVDGLDSKRETIALIPSLISRVANLERAVFRLSGDHDE